MFRKRPVQAPSSPDSSYSAGILFDAEQIDELFSETNLNEAADTSDPSTILSPAFRIWRGTERCRSVVKAVQEPTLYRRSLFRLLNGLR